MDTSKLKKFALDARKSLIEQVSIKLEQVLAESSIARRESAEAVRKLEEALKNGKEQVIERVAYTWFNRFCALRFMDVNRYNKIGVVSPLENQFQPEILAEAKMGHIDEEIVPIAIQQKIHALLAGKNPSHDPQGEAYRLMLVAACNYWHRAMPFLFNRIETYTELLMPEDLLSEGSVLADLRQAITVDNCQNVEIIGWLYQYYISEKKEGVFADLKKNKKVSAENIPAATQLFTPHWIVRYLVENSLGRLWMLNHPHSKLVEKMDYYIKSEQPDQDFLRITKPEEIKICDPACGSGHMLVYAFDLLYAIYEEEGYESSEIPKKILTHNLYGIEIDERAGELAALALVMKARAKQRRFFHDPVQPKICVLENVKFDEKALNSYMDFAGKDLFTEPLQLTLHQFEEAKNFGSLIRPEVADVTPVLNALKANRKLEELLYHQTHRDVLLALEQADYLSTKYHVVIANPPYMGSKGMNDKLQNFAKTNYPNSKSNLFSMFIERNLQLTLKNGSVAMITMQSWMFLSAFAMLRIHILSKKTILSMIHLGAHAFDSIGGEVVSTTAFVLKNSHIVDFKGQYIRLVEGNSEAEKDAAFRQVLNMPNYERFFYTTATNLMKLSGSPISYWASEKIYTCFDFDCKKLIDIASPKIGIQSGNNEKHYRQWYELCVNDLNFNIQKFSETNCSSHSWFPLQQGGSNRKWYGNNQSVVNLKDGGSLILKTKNASLRNSDHYFKESLCWNRVNQGKFYIRYIKSGFAFDDGSPFITSEGKQAIIFLFSLLGSNSARFFFQIICTGLKTEVGHVSGFPLPKRDIEFNRIHKIFESLVNLSKSDWNSYETSWDFTALPLLLPEYHQSNLQATFPSTHQTILQETYSKLRAYWQKQTLEMQQLEEENNRIFIEAYGLQDELTPEVPLDEITLTCNPQYRYGGNKSQEELEALLLADTMKEFISYAVGCMFGRYALDKPGLILANQGETFQDYLKHIPEPIFSPQKENVIPIIEGEWFSDDISESFNKFLRTTFGEKHYSENLKFIEEAIGKDIRKYFLKDFYNDHLKRYKKRPIYWLFSSPKGSFNVLIYMHRYRPENVSIILNDYLREFHNKLLSHLDHLKRLQTSSNASVVEKTKSLKEIDRLKKIIDELNTYERDILYPLASEQLKIDFDDGVKVNYIKFGDALRKITGLESKED